MKNRTLIVNASWTEIRSGLSSYLHSIQISALLKISSYPYSCSAVGFIKVFFKGYDFSVELRRFRKYRADR